MLYSCDGTLTLVCCEKYQQANTQREPGSLAPGQSSRCGSSSYHYSSGRSRPDKGRAPGASPRPEASRPEGPFAQIPWGPAEGRALPQPCPMVASPAGLPSHGLQTVPLGAKREPAPSGSRGVASLDRPFMGTSWGWGVPFISF